jgi:hypothetical protein
LEGGFSSTRTAEAADGSEYAEGVNSSVASHGSAVSAIRFCGMRTMSDSWRGAGADSWPGSSDCADMTPFISHPQCCGKRVWGRRWRWLLLTSSCGKRPSSVAWFLSPMICQGRWPPGGGRLHRRTAQMQLRFVGNAETAPIAGAVSVVSPISRLDRRFRPGQRLHLWLDALGLQALDRPQFPVGQRPHARLEHLDQPAQEQPGH